MGKTESDRDRLVSEETKSYNTNAPTESLQESSFPPGPSLLSNTPEPRQLSMFFGVVVPCVLSMFSVILFLRMGFIVGQAGLIQSLVILLLSYVIIGLTVLSVCAISTNGAIEGGGAYFMISRALGAEFGGAIGLMFFLANVASAAMYVFGIVEALGDYFGPTGEIVRDVVPVGKWEDFGYGSGILFLCFIICLVGANIYAKTTFVIFLIVMLSITSVIVSFFAKRPFMMTHNKTLPDRCNFTSIYYTGLNKSTLDANIPANYSSDYDRNKNSSFTHAFSVFFTTKHALLTVCTLVMERMYRDEYTVDYTTKSTMDFISVFAVFFNGCIGINAGANMSGELKDPSKAIPVGTILACVITCIIYLLLMVFIAATTPRDLLQCDYTFLVSINVWPPFVVVGILASSLSAVLSQLIGASRILLALAKDELFGVILRPVTMTTKGGNPFVAVLVTWFLVQLVLFAGKVNTIAPVVTIFFLFAYAAVDMSCLALEWASAPNFRPTFKYFTWHTCLLGMLSCVVMMFLIQPIYTSISIVVLVILTIVIHYRVPTSSWGYISQALIFHQVRKYLLMLDVRKEHVKFWRPQILLMVKNPRTCCQLIDFINSIKKSGLYVLGHVSPGRLADMREDALQAQQTHWMNLVDQLGVKAFVELTLSASVREGTEQLLRLSGLGGMKPNTLVLGYYDESPAQDTFGAVRIFTRGGTTTSSMAQVPPSATVASTDSGDFFSITDDSFGASNFSKDRILPQEYIEIISDAIKLRKNVCLGRYFYELNKTKLTERRQSGEVLYIDVWPVNFLYPVLHKNQATADVPSTSSPMDMSSMTGVATSSYFDVTSVFLMQMACILNMTPFWKKNVKLRINLCSEPGSPDSEDCADEEIQEFLNVVRIKAKIRTIQWERASLLHSCKEKDTPPTAVHGVTGASPGIQDSGLETAVVDTESGFYPKPVEKQPELHATHPPAVGEDDDSVKSYLQSVNSLIKSRMSDSVVTFLYLPAPPSDESEYLNYLNMLTAISEGLGPTLFVHGLSQVVSTSL